MRLSSRLLRNSAPRASMCVSRASSTVPSAMPASKSMFSSSLTFLSLVWNIARSHWETGTNQKSQISVQRHALHAALFVDKSVLMAHCHAQIPHVVGLCPLFLSLSHRDKGTKSVNSICATLPLTAFIIKSAALTITAISPSTALGIAIVVPSSP